MYRTERETIRARRYRVIADHATVRTQPRQDGEVLWRLSKGEEWVGVETIGGGFNAPGFGSSTTWISHDGHHVWGGYLQEITE